MGNLSTRRVLVFAACLGVVGAVAAGQDAAGQDASGQDAAAQSCPEAGPASAPGTGAPYVAPPPATCDPGQYISASDGAAAPDGPGPTTWTGPPGYDASPPSYSGDIYQTLGITKPNVAAFTYNSVQAPYPDAAGCKMFDAQGHQSVHDCLCTNCFAQMQECDALVGCRAIIKCSWDTGCDPSAALTSTTSCYPLFGTGGCAAPINKYGTGSVSTALSQELGMCGQNNSCPAQ